MTFWSCTWSRGALATTASIHAVSHIPVDAARTHAVVITLQGLPITTVPLCVLCPCRLSSSLGTSACARCGGSSQQHVQPSLKVLQLAKYTVSILSEDSSASSRISCSILGGAMSIAQRPVLPGHNRTNTLYSRLATKKL